MRHFIIFYSRNPDGSYSEKLGSNGVVFLDNRLGRARQHEVARTIGNSLKAFHVDDYRIARGQRLDRLFFLTATVQSL